jgi:hypothetical protein
VWDSLWAHGLRTSVLRLTNTYDPRVLVRNNRQTFIGWFIRQALDGEEIPVFGDGQQLRDATYSDDVIDALLLCPGGLSSGTRRTTRFLLITLFAEKNAQIGRECVRCGIDGQHGSYGTAFVDQMPSLTVCWSPSGEPMAMAVSPIASWSESPSDKGLMRVLMGLPGSSAVLGST